MNTSQHPDPCIILLAYAHSSAHIEFEEMESWAAELGIERSDLIEAFGSQSLEEENFARRGERRSPLAARPQTGDILRQTLATAYAHGHLELDDLLSWAEELSLAKREVAAVLREAAELAYGADRRRPYGITVTPWAA